MVFTGEASWRWRMMLPASDRSYETFWRQAVRWLAIGATDPVAVVAPAGTSAGDMLPLRVIARNASFEPLADATVDVRVTAPDGRLEHLRAAAEDSGAAGGRFVARSGAQQPGVYRVTAEARRGAESAGAATVSVLGGVMVALPTWCR